MNQPKRKPSSLLNTYKIVDDDDNYDMVDSITISVNQAVNKIYQNKLTSIGFLYGSTSFHFHWYSWPVDDKATNSLYIWAIWTNLTWESGQNSTSSDIHNGVCWDKISFFLLSKKEKKIQKLIKIIVLNLTTSRTLVRII